MFGLGNVDMAKIQAKLDSIHYCANCGIFFTKDECPVCGLKVGSEGGEPDARQTEPEGDRKAKDRPKGDDKTFKAVKTVIEWINS